MGWIISAQTIFILVSIFDFVVSSQIFYRKTFSLVCISIFVLSFCIYLLSCLFNSPLPPSKSRQVYIYFIAFSRLEKLPFIVKIYIQRVSKIKIYNGYYLFLYLFFLSFVCFFRKIKKIFFYKISLTEKGILYFYFICFIFFFYRSLTVQLSLCFIEYVNRFFMFSTKI